MECYSVYWVGEVGMKECVKCKHKGELSHVCDECLDGEMFEKKAMTNADRIRSMTDEELAEFLCTYDACVMCSHNSDNMCTTRNCDEIGITERWLKSEMEKE